ncbi:MAG: phospholipid carrier-dependent glycosyltransferase [Phycisphaerales bacterium]|nr:MAG: phospholipid carrier-dependent glycosyltransferase [Phycisphaerales bacterium]
MVLTPPDASADRPPPAPYVFAIALVILAVLCVGLVSPYAMLTVLIDGSRALVVLVPPALAGLWLVPLLRLGPLPWRWHLLLGSALGLGAGSVLVLVLGLVGILHRPIWIGILVILFAAGAMRVRALLDPVIAYALAFEPDERPKRRVLLLWLPAAALLCLALLAASNAPGFIWSEEAFGYDVLEYHLQLPKEYHQAGGISYLPHNVYANFPAGVEMFYLLAMIVFGDVLEIGTTANMIHLLFGALTVFAAWVAGCTHTRKAGLLTGILTATAGWLCYLCGLAYVENGMLFLGFAAIACALKTRPREDSDSQSSEAPREMQSDRTRWGWFVAAGLAAGFACGCKYPAVPMIALPIGLAVLMLPSGDIGRRITSGLVFALAALAAFAPWLIKNQLMTGNPVFPLANHVFNASPLGWGDEQTAQWERGHSLKPEEATIGGRLRLLWRHVLADRYSRFGPAIFVLALGGLARRTRGRTDVTLLLILFVQLLVWGLATHLYARFAVVFLIPLALLAGRALNTDTAGTRTALVLGVALVGMLWNLYFAVRLNRIESPNGAPASLIYEGQLPEYQYLKAVNDDLPKDARVLLIGDARAFYFRRHVDYSVVFNRDPFAEVVRLAEGNREIMGWLRQREYSHVLVNWTELARLSRTYGFPPEITPELFTHLERDGLELTRRFSHPVQAGLYVDLHTITPPPRQ